MKKYPWLLFAALLLSCNSNDKKTSAEPEPKKDSATITPPPVAPDNISKIDTISTLSNMESTATHYFHAPNGQYYKMILVADPEEVTDVAARSAALDCATDIFHGNDRKACKLSLVSAALQSYTSLSSFLQTLPSDNTMRNNPAITTDANNPRVAAEKRNVKLTTNIWLFAIKRESDNDYHIIIGDQNNHYFNIECSGFPATTASSYTTIKKVRKQVEDFFGELCSNQYSVFENGIRLGEVKGSLFYDIDHAPGVVGPAGHKPTTAWEIHPISNILFQ